MWIFSKQWDMKVSTEFICCEHGNEPADSINVLYQLGYSRETLFHGVRRITFRSVSFLILTLHIYLNAQQVLALPDQFYN
jgi:hypothetical protein